MYNSDEARVICTITPEKKTNFWRTLFCSKRTAQFVKTTVFGTKTMYELSFIAYTKRLYKINYETYNQAAMFE